MSHDYLQAISKLRRITLDSAKQIFAASLAEEGLTRHQLEITEALIYEEGKIAANLSTDDNGVEAYAAWLPRIRAKIRTDHAAYDKATANVLLARAALNIAHAAAEAVTNLQKRHAAEADLVSARKSQAEMDEIGARVTSAKSQNTQP